MTMICYEPKRFGAERLALIERCNRIIAAYQRQGYDLTLRQLYYQLVARDVIPNTQRSYKNLGNLVSEARRAGLISWQAIVDRTRNLRSIGTWDSPSQIMGAVASQFRFDLWENQPAYIEVWFEKEALAGVFERAANRERIPWFACRGYPSDSEVWGAARRLAGERHRPGGVHVLHFGDHDPSGIDMTRDIEERLALFNAPRVRVKRLALNMDQVEQYSPPPNPAKETDSRFAGYLSQHGGESWELDALEPTVLASLLEEEVSRWRDDVLWAADLERERVARAQLRAISERWDEVEALVGEPDGELDNPNEEE
jgi:hypothetical protein